MPELSSSPHRWNQIKRLPIHPQVQTLAQYEEAVRVGSLDALDLLRSIQVNERLTVAVLQSVHFHMFKSVHPWAGQFRTPGQMAVVAGFPAADTSRIRRELELALFQTRQLITSASGDPIQLLAAISFLHARYERIHPFLDGNGRSGRTLLAVQFETVFGHLPKFSDQRGYREAIRATASGDLGPFVRYIGLNAGIPLPSGIWPSAYRIAPRFLETGELEPSFEEDLHRSITWRRS